MEILVFSTSDVYDWETRRFFSSAIVGKTFLKDFHQILLKLSVFALPEASKFIVDQVIHDFPSKIAMNLWQNIQTKLARTYFGEVQKILGSIE